MSVADDSIVQPRVTFSRLDDVHVAVAAVVERGADDPRCAATLISPHVALTAAHCVSAVPASAVQLIFHYEGGARERVDIVDRLLHPAFDEAAFGVHDLALARLATAPRAMPLSLAERPGPTLGEDVALLAFGTSTPGSLPKGERRIGTASVFELNPTTFRLHPEPSLSCGGDSGGAVLSRSSTGTNVLAGVIVSGDTECASFTRAMRLTAYRDDFIEPFVQEVDPVAALSATGGGCAVGQERPASSAVAWSYLLVALLGSLALRYAHRPRTRPTSATRRATR